MIERNTLWEINTINNYISSQMGFSGNITEMWDTPEFSDEKYIIKSPENVFLANINDQIIFNGLNLDINNWLYQCNTSNIIQFDKNTILVRMTKNDDFQTFQDKPEPRAELCCPILNIINGNTYKISFSTYLNGDFHFEQYDNPVTIFQIHQELTTGNHSLTIGLDKGSYFTMSNNCETGTDSIYSAFSPISFDLGHWINWEITYKPSNTTDGLININKNGQDVFHAENVKTAYNCDNYFKIGVCKLNWLINPSSIDEISIFYSNLTVVQL